MQQSYFQREPYAIYIASLSAAVLFGFFFTMSFCIMPGLDLSDPTAALEANQKIGRATKGSIFFIALLGTPLALLIAIVLHKTVRILLGLALLCYILMMLVTFFGNVPLNNILDAQNLQALAQSPQSLWLEYSEPWQNWNLFRVVFSGLSALFILMALRRA